MKVFLKQITKQDLVIGEPYYLNSDGTSKMIFVGFDEEDNLSFYPIGDTCYSKCKDGTVPFCNPFLWEEYEEA